MQSHALDRYVPRDSLVHRLDPRVKLGIALLAILSNVALPDGAWLGFLLGWSILLLATLLARLDLLFTVRRSFVALPFAANVNSQTFPEISAASAAFSAAARACASARLRKVSIRQ